MPHDLRDHPLRHTLSHELHARPFAPLEPPEQATHLALLSGEGAVERDRAHIARLCAHFGIAGPGSGDTHLMADLGPLRVKWERHTEFSTYTFFRTPAARMDAPVGFFDAPVIDALPPDWLAGLPGELLVGIHLAVLPSAAAGPDPAAVHGLFGTDNIAGSLVSGSAAAAFMGFHIHEDGFGRILVHDHHMRPRQAGRLVQRLLEIETYRMMALLALPVARNHARETTKAGERLTELITRMATLTDLQGERRLLAELTDLSAQVEGVAAAAHYRFGAARAYHGLVRQRIEELREERIEGYQTISEFLGRRLSPAMSTCAAAAERLDSLARRVSRAANLLRTRVDIQLEAQNSDLLRSMNRRAQLQIRLQQTVEGLSIAAISYYMVGLVAYAAKAAKDLGLPLDPDVVAGAAIVPVVALVALGVVRLRRHIQADAEDAER